MIDVDENFIKRNLQSGNPAISGVYFLIRKGELIYIGSSDDINKRLKHHKKHSFFKFDKFSIYPLPLYNNLLKRTERECIKKFKPKYNCQYNPDYQNGEKRVWFTFIKQWQSYKLVAEECGVSLGTVSRVINERPKKGDNVELVNRTILTREKQIAGFKKQP